MSKTLAHNASDKTIFGFWVYIMTDCVLFASLFATFAVLHNNTYGGESGAELFKLPFVFAETAILLTSSYTSGLAMLALNRQDKQRAMDWLKVTMILGAMFLALEISEFHNLVVEGNSWRRSGFLSAFFTLVGTHGAHITAGLIWASTLLSQLKRKGITTSTVQRLTMFSLFWHFLDIIWIFIFSIVYLLGRVL